MEQSASPASDLDLVALVRERFRTSKDATSEWRKGAREDYNMYSGEQWSDSDKKKLQDELRPIVVFNRIHPVVETVTGMEISNRQEIRYIPREPGAAAVNEILTGAAKWVRDECNAEDEESEAFRDMVICGIGVTETRLEYESDQDGLIEIIRIDPMEMYWDPAARKQNMIDAGWMMRVRDVPRDWVMATWPDKYDEVVSGELWTAVDDDTLVSLHDPSNPAKAYTETDTHRVEQRQGKVRLVEYQWREYEPYYRVVDPETSEIKEIDAETFLKISDRAAQLGLVLDSVPQKRAKVYRAFISGSVVFEVGSPPDPMQFSYDFMTGYRDRNSNLFYGIVRPMKDPQRWANKWLAQSMHIINTNAKGGLIAEKDAFDNIREAESSWAKPESITVVRPGGLGKIKDKVPASYPQGTNELMQFAIASIRDVTGVNVEMLGLANRDQPAMLEFQRKQSAVTLLSTLFDSLRRYRKQHGRKLLYMIQEYISDDRLVRIKGQKGEEYVQLAKDDLTRKYDVIIDDAPTSPNEKQRVWELLVQILPIIPTIGLPLIPELLDYVPLPASLVQTWKAYIDQMNQPNPNQEAMQKLQGSLMQSMAQQAQGESQKAMADAQKSAAEAALKTAQAQAQNPQIEAMKTLAEMTKMQAEAQKIQAELGTQSHADTGEFLAKLAQAYKTYQEALAVVPGEIAAMPVVAEAMAKHAGGQASLMGADAKANSMKLKSFSDLAVAIGSQREPGVISDGS